MHGVGWTLPAAAGSAFGFVTFLVLALLAQRLARRGRLPASAFDAGPSVPVFLFDDEVLVDATPGARQLLALGQREGSAWRRLMQVLMPRFPDLEERLSELLDRGRLEIDSADGRARVEAEWQKGLARLTVVDVARRDGDVPIDKLTLQALEDELETLRAIATEVPYLTWKQDALGRIVWANAAYIELAEALAPKPSLPLWPPPQIFPEAARSQAAPRLSVHAGQDERWYDLSAVALKDGCLRVAMPADGAVRAERGRIEFLQTLTKTFATLSAGLAVFDRTRRLVLFNPALADLTGLPVEFLILRPDFSTFVERLREARVLPEPRDFKGWKQRVTRVEAEAEQGTFAETWTLPGGQVFDVTGRPLPDGAIAFVVQDVSDGMRLTRQFRNQIELHQALLDRIEPAVAVFAADGARVLSNAAYRRLWGGEADEGLSLDDSLRLWRTNCPTTRHWAQLSETPPAAGDPIGLVFTAERITGHQIECRFLALPGGALMASFADIAQARSLPRRRPSQKLARRV